MNAPATTDPASPVGKVIGYCRASTDAQQSGLDTQVASIRGRLSTSPRTGEPLLFTDLASGKNTDRPGLDALRDYAREGDLVLIPDMSRLSRDLGDLISLVKEFNSNGVGVEFQHEHLVVLGDDSPIASLILGVMGSVAEFQRKETLRRTREGVARAKAAGKYRGRVAALKPDQIEQARRLVQQGVSKARVARDLKVSRTTLLAALNGTGTYATT